MLASPQVQRKLPRKTHGGQNIKVFVRLRPMNSSEKNAKCKSSVECQNSKEIVVQERPQDNFSKKFSFDKVFGQKSNQIDLYKSVAKPLVDEVLNGFNCTIFAYGQTGTGKTYTMEGEHSSPGASWEENPHAGIIPRCVNQLFDELRVQQLEFTMRVSFLELYNEELFDLLSAHDDLSKLRLYEDASRKGSCIIQGLEEVLVRSKSDVYDIIEKGSAKRQTAATLMNAHSSRSHTVFTVTIHIKENTLDGTELLKTGKLHLVDLAGSENIGKSGAVDKRAREAGNINQSLLTLGRVITSLVDRAPHVPYRESKLTRLLQDALGGRTKTSIIATISPASVNLEETLSTLDYAHRAKNIQNKPEVNQKLNKKEVITEYTLEIDRLRKDLMAMREKNGVYLANENYQEMVTTMEQQVKEISDKISHIRALEEDLEKQKDNFVEVNSKLEETSSKLTKTETNLSTTKEALQSTQKLLSVTTNQRDEQKFLVTSHQDTEEKLLKQGKGLIRVADTTTSDIEKLHQKIDRKRNVEDQNEKIEETFSTQYDNQLKDIQQNISNTIRKVTKLSSVVSNSLDEGRTTYEAALNEIVSNFSEISKWSDKTLGSLKAHHSAQQTENLQEVTSLTTTISTVANETQQQLSQFELNTFAPSMEKIIELLLAVNISGNELQESASANLCAMETLSHGTCNTLLELSRKLQENQEKLSANQLEQRAKEEATDKEFSEQINRSNEKMESLYHTMMATTNEYHKLHQLNKQQTDAFLQHRHDKLTEVQEIRNKHADTVCVLLSEFSRAATSFSKDHSNAKKQTDEIVQQRCEKIRNSITCSQLEAGSVQSSVQSCVQKTLESIASLSTTAQATEQALTAVTKDVDNFHRKLDIVTADMTQKICSGNTQIQSQQKLTADCMAENAEAVHTASQTLNTQFQSHTDSLNECSETVVNLFTTDLQRDIPTGETPVRKDYAYTRVLAETLPHQNLLSRFRNCLDYESKIPLPNTSLELDAEENVIDASLHSLPATYNAAQATQQFALQRSESFKEPLTFAVPAPRSQRHSSEDKVTPLTKCSSESSLKDVKENEDGHASGRKLRAPKAIPSYSSKKTEQDKHRARKILGPSN